MNVFLQTTKKGKNMEFIIWNLTSILLKTKKLKGPGKFNPHFFEHFTVIDVNSRASYRTKSIEPRKEFDYYLMLLGKLIVIKTSINNIPITKSNLKEKKGTLNNQSNEGYCEKKNIEELKQSYIENSINNQT
jgi:hypothetical protein